VHRGGEKVDLGKVDIPVYIYGSREDQANCCPQDIVIVAAARTAVGKFGGSLAKTPAPELGAIVIKEAWLRAKLDPASRSARSSWARCWPPARARTRRARR
jgi:hypothetical protein